MRQLRVLGVLVLLLVAAGAAAIVILNTMDWSQYQEPLVQAVEDATGRKLAIDGQLRLRLGLSPAVTMGGVTFSNAEWGSRSEMATVSHFALRLKLWPLLLGRVEVERLELRGLDVLLETSATGEGNWVFKPTATTVVAEGHPEEEKEAELPSASGDGSTMEFRVSEVLIGDLGLVYRDGVSGQVRQLRADRLVARQARETAPLTLELTAHYNSEPVILQGTLEGVRGVMRGDALGLDLTVQAGGALLEAQGQVAEPLEGKGIGLAISIKGKTPAALSGLVGTSLPDLGSYEASAAISDGESEYRVRDLQIRVGTTKLAGQVALQGGGGRPRIDAALRSARVDLADFRERARESVDAASNSGGDAAPGRRPLGDGEVEGPGEGSGEWIFPDDPLSLEGLRALDADLSLNVAELVQNEIALQNLELRASLRAGVLRVKPMRMELSRGRIGLQLALDGSTPRASVATQVDIDQVDLGELLTTLDVTEVLSGGKLNLHADLAGRGSSVRGIMSSLKGHLELEMGTGTIQNRWAELMMADVGSLIAKGGKTDRAEVNCIVSRFDVDRGVARATNLVMDTTRLAVFGDGHVDLGEEQLELRLEPMAKKRGVSLAAPPVRLRGRLASPEFALAGEAIVGKAAGMLAQLAVEGSVDTGGSIVTQPGVAGCQQLLAERERRMEKATASRAELERTTRRAAEEAAKGLKRLFGN